MSPMPPPGSHRTLRELLEAVKEGHITVDAAEREMNLFSIDHIADIASVDCFRHRRKGVPEVVYADSKLPEDAADIALHLAERNGFAFLTRAGEEHHAALMERIAGTENGDRDAGATYGRLEVSRNRRARTILLRREGFTFGETGGRIGVLTAGTSDIPVAEEAVETCKVMGCETVSFHDVGVAGIHRLFEPLKKMVTFDVHAIIVVAGMEGALPSVVSALVEVPVIGVPSSVGYGYGGKGETALMSMLQSCSPGLAVVNIDNGFGAGVAASLMARRCVKDIRNGEGMEGRIHGQG